MCVCDNLNINKYTLTHTCFCCVSDLPGNIAWAVWTGRSLLVGESWLRDSGLRLAVCSVFPPGHSHSKCVCGRLTAPPVHLLPPTTSRNRKSGMFLQAAVTGPDKIKRYRERERERECWGRERTADLWPTRPLGSSCGGARFGVAVTGLLPAASDSTPTSPLSLCLCERTRHGHHTYTTAEIWPRLQTERLEEENFTTLSHLLFLYLLYGARTHTHKYTRTGILMNKDSVNECVCVWCVLDYWCWSRSKWVYCIYECVCVCVCVGGGEGFMKYSCATLFSAAWWREVCSDGWKQLCLGIPHVNNILTHTENNW